MSPLVFICHATEDKDVFVRPLAEALHSAGVPVWYDEFSLRPGDSLRESIDRGLAVCRHAIVVLSRAFFAKKWTQWELNGLVHRHLANNRDVIIPVWLDVDADFVAHQSPSLTDIVAFRAERGVEQLVSFLHDALSKQDSGRLPPLPVSAGNLSARTTGLLTDALIATRDLFGASISCPDNDIHCTLMLIDSTRKEPVLVRGPSTLDTPPMRVPLGSSLTGWTFYHQKPVRVDDLSSWSPPGYRVSHLQSHRSSSLVAAPVTAGTKSGPVPLGVLSIMFQQPLKSLSDSQRDCITRFVECLASLFASIINADIESNETGT